MVRVWCVPVEKLDRQHLLGEHCELHVIFNVITKKKKGFYNHPQTNRFKQHLGQLFDRHIDQVYEMVVVRGYKHNSPLPYTEWEPYEYSNEEMDRDLEVLKERQK